MSCDKIDANVPDSVRSKFKLFTDKNNIYACALNMADVISNCNKSYILQLLTRNMETFIVYSRFGRVGQTGQINTDVFIDQEQAINEFKKIFHDKTGTDWSKRYETNSVIGKYSYVLLKYEDTAPLDKTLKEITLDEEVVRFIKLIYDPSLYSTTGSQYHFDTKKLPLGSLGFNQIKRAKSILDKLSLGNDVNTLSSEFYTVLPSVGKLKPLTTQTQIKEKYDLLEMLENMCYVSENIGSDIMDKYTSLTAHISPVSTADGNMIRKYFNMNAGKTHHYSVDIVGMYQIDKPHERQRYRKWESLHNKQLLWHGSPMANAVGILSAGLRIVAHPANGSMFGRGLYFANISTKSIGYTRIQKGGYGIMFLCEVALGNCTEHATAANINLLPPNKHSLLCRGNYSPEPENHIEIDGDVVVPIGKPVNSSVQRGLIYDEYVIYDMSQIKLRYAIIIKHK